MSVEVNIEPEGFEEFTEAIRHFDSKMQEQLKQRLAEWAEKTRAEASRLAPVRTGYLRSTVYARTQEWNAEIGVEANYAGSVEFGTRYAQAKPFLNPAVQANAPELERLFLQALDSAKAEAGL